MRLIIAATLCLWCSMAIAGDWPQIHGPTRSGQAQQEELPKTPRLKVAWNKRLGTGYAGPAIADGRITPLVDRVFAFDELPAAKAHLEADAAVGKVVVKVAV